MDTGLQWQEREQEETDQLQQAALSGRLLGEDQLALIPRFPSPWRYIPRPDSLPPWLPGRDLDECRFYHPLIDKLSGGGQVQHAQHQSWWKLLPISRPSMQRVPKPKEGEKPRDLLRIHYNHWKTHKAMGAINFWLSTLCHICGNPRHPKQTCARPPSRIKPSTQRPCPYCGEDHGVAICVMLHTRCKR